MGRLGNPGNSKASLAQGETTNEDGAERAPLTRAAIVGSEFKRDILVLKKYDTHGRGGFLVRHRGDVVTVCDNVAMASYTEHAMEDAFAQGRANAETIELARRHCLDMEFVEWGGQGMAEAASGLPINMRTIRCPVAQGHGAAMNLAWIAGDFYAEHCVGCTVRRPTGDVPNLATVMEARSAAAVKAADAEAALTEQQRAQWRERLDQRQSLTTQVDPAMGKALADLGVVDTQPGVENVAERTAALRRICVLAERAPETFTAEVVGHTLHLVNSIGHTDLLTPLRHLARSRQEFAVDVLQAAIIVLRRAPDIDASRCLVDYRAYLNAGQVDVRVVWSLVHLAGAPEYDFPPWRRFSIAAADATGVRVAADVAPDSVVAVLRQMLPGPVATSPLVVPMGLRSIPEDVEGTDHDRAAAAGAARALATTHPTVVAQVVDALVRTLGLNADDHYDLQPLGMAKRALATMLLLNVGDVHTKIEAAGRTAGRELRERLFDVYEQLARLLDPEDRWREPGDPLAGAARRSALLDRLLATCLVRVVGGDWGHHTSYAAAHLIASLAQMDPDWMLSRLDAVLGAFVGAVADLDRRTSPSLDVVDATPAQMHALEEFSRRSTVSSTCRELLDAVERAAAGGAATACAATKAIIAKERQLEGGVEVVRRLLPLLGKVGCRHGDQPAVLKSILPTLHTYLVDAEVPLRSAALDAWIDIASAHPVPSSLSDLLPAFIADPYAMVVRSVLRASERLTWSDDDRTKLVQYALSVCAAVDVGADLDTLKAAMSAVGALTGGDERLRPYGDELLLRRATALSGYDLRDALRRSWSPGAAHSAAMASLRLAQARDPRINDRFNASDDEELCLLLGCGAGLIALPLDELTAAALELAPEYPLASAEFAEVAWRAGRPADAASVMRAVIDATPPTPAFDGQRAFAQAIADAAQADADVASDVAGVAIAALERTVAAAGGDYGEVLANVLAQVRCRLELRRLLAAQPAATDSATVRRDDDVPSRPADAARSRASRLVDTADDLRRLSQKATATGAYLRSFANACDVAAHLLRLDGAELDADLDGVRSHATAARRKAEILQGELSSFAADDPIVAPLGQAVVAAAAVTQGSQVAPMLTTLASLPLPLAVVDGPRSRRRMPHTQPTTSDNDDVPVAVVLASVDGQLVTGPQVLRSKQVYELRLDVRPGSWPQWADRLDAELLSHLSEAEVETPTFSWPRPSVVSPVWVHARRGRCSL